MRLCCQVNPYMFCEACKEILCKNHDESHWRRESPPKGYIIYRTFCKKVLSPCIEVNDGYGIAWSNGLKVKRGQWGFGPGSYRALKDYG